MQKSKKLGIAILVISLIFILNLIFDSSCLAAQSTSVKYFGLYNHQNSRKYIQNKDMYYSVVTNTNSELPVYEIAEYAKDKSNSAIQPSQEQIFSLKSGFVYGSKLNYNGNTIKKYDHSFNMKAITPSNNSYLSSLPQDISTYNKIMWILEKIEDPNDVDRINNLLREAGISATKTKNEKQVFMTKTAQNNTYMSETEFVNAVKVIEQCAIWHFSNNDNLKPKVGKSYDAINGIKASTNVVQYLSDDLAAKMYTNSYDNPMIQLYNYLVNGAEFAVNTSRYSYNDNKETINFETQKAKVIENDINYLIGPYYLNGNRNLTSFVVKVEEKDITNDIDIIAQNGGSFSGNSILEKVNNTKGQDFYIKADKNLSGVLNIAVNSEYDYKEIKCWTAGANSIKITEPIVTIKTTAQSYYKTDNKALENPQYDFALRMFVTEITRSTGAYIGDFKERKPDTSSYDFGLSKRTTLYKKHSKKEISLNKGDKVSFNVRVYNEGNVVGRVSQVSAYLPNGLKLTNRNTWVTEGILDNGYTKISNTSLSLEDINPYSDRKLDYRDIKLECEVTLDTSIENVSLKIVSEIDSITDTRGNFVEDKDSNPESLSLDQIKNYKSGNSEDGIGYQDDDDYENLVMTSKYLDFALRMYIYSINGVLVGEDGNQSRVPRLDLSPLQDESDSTTTAYYYQNKRPLNITTGDIIIYNIDVYNEGLQGGYVSSIVNHLPPELEFISDDKDVNAKNGWVFVTSEDGSSDLRNVRTSKLDSDDKDNLIEPFDGKNIDKRTVQLKLKVKETAQVSQNITNIAEIASVKDNEGRKSSDIDNSKNVTLPEKDSDFPAYKGNSENKDDLGDSNFFYKGQEDDDDFEKIVIEEFDLALRQFITKVNDTEFKNPDGSYSRAPFVNTIKYGTTQDNIKTTSFEYSYSSEVGASNNKNPVSVFVGDLITFNIRAYNEGSKSGYCGAIKYTIPDGLEYVSDNETNINNKWQLFDKEGNQTEDAGSAKYLTTDKTSNITDSSGNRLSAFDAVHMQNDPKYVEVRLCLRVTNIDKTNISRNVISTAEIYRNLDQDGNNVNDIDSSVNNAPEGVANEDDEDLEKIYIKYFNLRTDSWTQSITTIKDGNLSTIETGQTDGDGAKGIAAAEVNSSKLADTVVKFTFNIRIYNEGEVDGTASEIKDYIPKGFIFNQADNPKWELESDDVAITKQLKHETIKVGESVDVAITLTWDNDDLITRQIKNIIEISKNNSINNTPDINSTPNNKAEDEDDYDYALTKITTLQDNGRQKYLAILTGVLIIIIIGLFIIVKVVLK